MATPSNSVVDKSGRSARTSRGSTDDGTRVTAPVLTLHQGDDSAEFSEHPTEIARRALMAAAQVEDDGWPELLRRAASALPCRAPIKNEEA